MPLYDKGKHAWPRGVRTQRSQADTPSYDIDASEQMWHFFQDHSLQ
jgi:poly(3-hydroxybutyrate) depolymerase